MYFLMIVYSNGVSDNAPELRCLYKSSIFFNSSYDIFNNCKDFFN